MPAIQVRDFSDEAYAQIKAEAKASGRSITQQTKYIVMQYLEQRQRQQNEAADARSLGGSESAPDASLGAIASEARGPVPVKLQLADPYVPPRGSYPNPRRVEDEEVVAARVARRKAVFDRIASRNYPKEALEFDFVQAIREMRDER